MKLRTISVLLLLLVCLTVPFVTADKPIGADIGKEKIMKTPAAVEMKAVDDLAPAKIAIGWEANTDIEVRINGQWEATLPDDSPIKDVAITQECIALYPYGSLQWYQCEVA